MNSLPHDIERIVFEAAARGDPGASVQLATVARRVQGWIEPMLYETVTLQDSRHLKLFTRTFLYDSDPEKYSTKPPGFVVKSMKDFSLLFTPIQEQDRLAVISILQSCGDLASLAYWPDSNYTSSRYWELDAHCQSIIGPTIRGDLRPRRISGSLCKLTGMRVPILTISLFANVTHLDVKDPWSTWGRFPFHNIPSLRYLALENLDFTRLIARGASAVVARILEKCPQLVVCVILCRERSELLGYINETYDGHVDGYAAWGFIDPRIAALPAPSYHQAYCLHIPEGEAEMWRRAEEVLKARRLASTRAASISNWQSL
ncbi:hypothetical protein PLICRDRAFT_462120 [Plicaturopsis crispa FD-325 SS-3]|nr:hypothetical protein PLICRDRAFT_462120 [Plicaturopsis crispa FD-325 SS-3]